MINLKKYLILVTFVVIFILGSVFAKYADSQIKILPPDQQPQLILPESNQFITTLTPTFTWGDVPNQEYFEINISYYNGDTLVEVTFKVKQLEVLAAEGLLNYNCNYFWKVRACNSFGFGPWSDFYNFAVINPNVGLDNILIKNKLNKNLNIKKIKSHNNLSNPLISKNINGLPPEEQPQLILHENNQFIATLTPTFTWGDVPSEECFEFEISYYSGDTLVDFTFKTKQFDLLAYEGMLNYNTNYFWKVRACNSFGDGPWSDTYNFSVINPNVGVDKTVSINKGNNNSSGEKTKLNNNFPNPFNPTTKINYEIQTNSFVKITVYNMLGKEVKTLVNGYQNAGMHSIEFNASSLSSGIYICRLVSNSNISTIKMNLIK